MEGKDLSAKPSGSTIINVLETLFSSAHTGHLDKTLSEITVAMVSEKTTAKDVLSPSSFSSSLTSMESEASGDDTSNSLAKSSQRQVLHLIFQPNQTMNLPKHYLT